VHNEITALILAGGKSSRLDGEDKGLIHIAGQALIKHLINRLQPQVSRIVISANRNLESYKEFGFPVITDTLANFPGPLAGIYSAMTDADSDLILTAPCDSPFIPKDYAQRMLLTLQQQGDRKAVVAHDGKRIQPVFSLLSCELLPSLTQYLKAGHRKTGEWLLQQHPGIADFSDQENMFFNMNTSEDKALLDNTIKEPSL
jgi:molybdopterin-guanine dinucleotide biosynthesis protein A